MAVEAQHQSNVFSPGLRSWAQTGSVLQGVQTTQTRRSQMGHLLPSLRKTTVAFDSGDQQAAGLPNTSVLSYHPHGELACNLPGSRKGLGDQSHTPVTPVAVLPQLVRFSNPPLLATPTELKAGLSAHITSPLMEVSRDQSRRPFNSAATCISGRQRIIYAQLAQDPALISPELPIQICHQNYETDALIRFQNERLRLTLEELGKRHCTSLVSIFQQRIVRTLQEKDIELQNASRRNTELVERINQVSAENELWFNLAMNNEAAASHLKRCLEKALLENSRAVADAHLREGYGDSDGTQFSADDAQSCCFDDMARWAAPATVASYPEAPEIRHLVVCKVCVGDAACVLVLPCRHLCLCEDCETSVSLCPICNYPKKACLRIFMA